MCITDAKIIYAEQKISLEQKIDDSSVRLIEEKQGQTLSVTLAAKEVSSLLDGMTVSDSSQ